MYIMEKGDMNNGIIGTHLATNQPIEISLNSVEISYACDKNINKTNASWEYMCAMVSQRTGIDIIDNIQIDWIVIDGIKRVFH